MYGVNATGGAQFVNEGAKTNFPILHCSNVSNFSLKCLFEVGS